MTSTATSCLSTTSRWRGAAALLAVGALLPLGARAQQVPSPPTPAPAVAAATVGCETLTGLVTDEKKQPLTGATVVVQGVNDAFSTNSEGRYIIQPRNRATFARNAQVQISAVGYETRTLALADCQLPDVALTTLAGTRFKRDGRIKKTSSTGKIH